MSAKLLKEEIRKFHPRRSLIAFLSTVIGAWLITLAIPAGTESFGALSLIPAAFLIVYIFVTKRMLEALTLASIIGFMITAKGAMETSDFSANIKTPFR